MADAGLLAAQSNCPACTRRLQGHRAFALFTSQHQRTRSVSDAVSASSAPEATRSRPRANRSLAAAASALQRQHTDSVLQHRIRTQHTARLRGGEWHLSAAASDTATESVDDRPPPGCSRYTVEMRKPLGLVLEEDCHGSIFVAEVQAGGNASSTGLVSKGDQLIATSGYTYTRENSYQEVKVRSGEQVIRLPVRGEDFDTVMAAIRSHPSQRNVRLELQRCQI